MATDPMAMDFQQASGEKEEGGVHLFGALWRRKWIVLFLMGVGLGLGYLFFMQQPPEYESSAQLLLIDQRPQLPIAGVEADTSYDKTHEFLLMSPAIVERAVVNGRLASLDSLRHVSNPTTAIIAGLEVINLATERGAGSNVISLTYTSGNREDAAIVVEAIIEAHRQFLGDSYQDISSETIGLITQAKDSLDQQISNQKAAYQKFQFESPIVVGENGRTAYEERLAQIEAERASTVLENAKLQAQIDGIEAALQRGGSREAINLMVGHVAEKQQAQITTIEDELFPLLLEEQMLLESYGPDHPKIIAVRKRINLTRKHLTGKNTGEDDEPQDFFAIYIESLREQIKVGEQTLTRLESLYQKERDAAKEVSSFLHQDAEFRDQIARKERLFDAAIERLEEISLVKDAGGTNTEVISPASVGEQVAPDLVKILAIAGALGLVGGMGLALVVEMADRRFRSPDDIRDQLGLAVVGHIPSIPAEWKSPKRSAKGDVIPAIDAIVTAHHKPRGRAAEAYRAVRTSLFFHARSTGQRVIQVTSSHAGDGKTTLASNLAVLVAQSGKKVLLIEADFRRPRCHKVFGLDNTVGISSVITSETEIADATQKSGVENLSVMTCGPRPGNPAELLTSPVFEEMIDAVREEYDFVIVDTPPLLVVTDPSVVASRVDGVLLVMRLSKRTRDSARRSCEILGSLGVNVLGVVVNGIGKGNDYGYGSSYGGYRYSYHYGNGYGYDKDYRSSGYYEEELPTG
ncbi:MAG: polysaccharide biosynthesis tyrosine autokinase [Pirellulales bacterium]|nr:polysaccharide biosynthesis tyrosine autokinase [Pirellulales bacterium]